MSEPTSAPLAKLIVTNIWDQTYQVLKERILSRHFGANDKLLIPELAEQLGVSRTPIRDALNRLEMEGLVRTVSKVGTFVNAVQEDNVLDIMNSRLMIDCWTVDQLALLEPGELVKRLVPVTSLIEQASASLREARETLLDHSNYDLHFHLAFIRMGGNEKNVEIYKSLMHYRYLNLGEEHVSQDMVQHAFEQHLLIYRAIQGRAFEVAKTAIQDHLNYSKSNILKVIQENGGEI